MLVDLHVLARDGYLNDGDVASVIRDVPEEELGPEVERRIGFLLDGDCAWMAGAGDIDAAARAMLAQARAVDKLLYEQPDFGLSKVFEVGDHLVLAVPLPWAPAGDEVVDTRSIDRRGFPRRAILFHRIVPARVFGYRVAPTIMPLIGSPETIGAGLFQGLSVEVRYVPEPPSFVVDRVDCADHADQALAHLERAGAAGCDLLVWPELTIPPEVLDRVRDAVKWADPGAAPKLTVAGSWHQDPGPDDRVHNVCSVVDGHGDIVLMYRKKKAFEKRAEDGTLALKEHLRRDDEKTLPLIICGDRVVALAICRDFCDIGLWEGPLLGDLMADLVVVPSMGDEDTYEAHCRQADEMAVQNRTRSFVVQYPDTLRDDGTFGWVVDRNGSGRTGPVRETFAVFPPKRT